MISTLNPMFHARNFISNRFMRYLAGEKRARSNMPAKYLFDYANLSRAERRAVRRLLKVHGLPPNYLNWDRNRNSL